MERRITKDYVEELLEIYRSICELNDKNYEKLSNLKKRFYDYYSALEKYNILQMYLSKEIEEFLNEYNIDDFEKVHKTLEGIVFMNFWVDIVPCLMLSGKNKDYFNQVVNLNRLKFAKNYNEIYNLGIKSENNNLIIDLNKINVQKFDENEIEIEISKTKKQLLNLDKQRNKKGKLLKSEIKYIYDCLLLHLNFYKQFIEKNFYEVKELFLYYNIELRVFIGNSLQQNEKKDDYYEVNIYGYPNDSNDIYVYPYVLDYYSNISLNIEEMDKETSIKMFTSTILKNETKNILRISIEGIYEELIRLFWNVSDDELKDKFIANLFYLCGFIKVKKENDIYRLKKYEFNLLDQKLKTLGDEIYFVVPSNIFYIDDNYAENIIKKVNEHKIHNLIYCIGNVDSPRKDMFEKNNIKCINLKNIIKFMVDTNIINLVTLDIIKYIQVYNKDDLKKQNELKKKGEDLLKELDTVQVGKVHFKKFENIMSDIFDYLFKESFECYYSEKQSLEYGGHRIRDFVIANTAPKKEFWKQRKIEQNSKRIIVDFKNYTSVITQSTINDVSKYLNNKKGNFAIVVSARGIEKSAIKEQQFKYFDDNKLIIHVDQTDIVEMIYNKMNNSEVEIVLEKKLVELSVR